MPEVVLKGFDLGEQHGQCRRDFSIEGGDLGRIEMVRAYEPTLMVSHVGESGASSMLVTGESNVDLIDALYDDEFSSVLARLAINGLRYTGPLRGEA